LRGGSGRSSISQSPRARTRIIASDSRFLVQIIFAVRSTLQFVCHKVREPLVYFLCFWPSILPADPSAFVKDRCERDPPHSRVRLPRVTTAPSYDFGSDRGPSESGLARGENEGDHDVLLASRAYHRSHAFSSGENARYDRRQSTSPHAKQITAELAASSSTRWPLLTVTAGIARSRSKPPANCSHNAG
jgi:hypothetical protein